MPEEEVQPVVAAVPLEEVHLALVDLCSNCRVAPVCVVFQRAATQAQQIITMAQQQLGEKFQAKIDLVVTICPAYAVKED